MNKDALKAMLTKHEGLKHRPYRCSAGAKTIGVGHNYEANPLPPDIANYLKANNWITDSMIDRLLETDIRQATADCRVLFPDWDNFSDRRQIALVDFVFNLGFRRAAQFTNTIAAINTGRWKDAAGNMRNSLWATQVKGRAKTITAMIEEG